MMKLRCRKMKSMASNYPANCRRNQDSSTTFCSQGPHSCITPSIGWLRDQVPYGTFSIYLSPLFKGGLQTCLLIPHCALPHVVCIHFKYQRSHHLILLLPFHHPENGKHPNMDPNSPNLQQSQNVYSEIQNELWQGWHSCIQTWCFQMWWLYDSDLCQGYWDWNYSLL